MLDFACLSRHKIKHPDFIDKCNTLCFASCTRQTDGKTGIARKVAALGYRRNQHITQLIELLGGKHEDWPRTF